MARTDRASLLVHVSTEAVYAALTSRDALTRWLPPQGMHGVIDHFDLRPGGSFRLTLVYDEPTEAGGKTSADADVSEVRIRELAPGRRVVQEVDFESADPLFAGTMRMDWTLQETADGTDVTVTATNVPLGVSARDHAAGLTSSLANLAAYLEP